MIVEVLGVSTRNKGAELMLLAIKQHYDGLMGSIKITVDPSFGLPEQRAKYGLCATLRSNRIGRSALAIRLMPLSFRRAYGLVSDSDVDTVLDASGFAFGDQHGPRRTERLASAAERWKKQGKKVVLFPQALGPFSSQRLRSAFSRVIENVDLIFARDKASYRHVQQLGGHQPHVKLAPDFTNLVQGRSPACHRLPSGTACIVPNYRMVDSTDPQSAGAYIPFLATCIDYLRRNGRRVVVLLHDTSCDHKLLPVLQESVAQPLEVLREPDPVCLKGILGQAHVVVGSRYHALIGALSQAVPCLGVGWSHKYKELSEDYRCPELLLSVHDCEKRIQPALDRMIHEPARSTLINILHQAAREQVNRTFAMWSEVDRLLGLPQITASVRGQGDRPPHQDVVAADASSHLRTPS